MQADRTHDDVRTRDTRTLVKLRDAEDALQAALHEMPNDVRSAFDPRADVPAIMDALRSVQLLWSDVQQKAGAATTIIGRERGLVNDLTRTLHDASRTRHNCGSMIEDRRGSHFEVQTVIDDAPTGHVMRVTVELDRFEEQPR